MNAPLRVAVACSGGRDSMALLLATVRAARALGAPGVALPGEAAATIEVWALHVHHGLSDWADDWAQHVEQSCRAWAARGWPVRSMVRRVTVEAPSPHGLEAAARHARYQALTEMAHGLHIDLVLLGHHRQDQAETVLLQALRGGSLAGLAAMPTRRDREGIAWVRPWLNQPRCRIEVYGRLHGLTHVDDDSNSDPRFARNRLRTQVWPALTAAFPQGEQALADTADRLADAQSVVQAWASSVLPADEGVPWALSDWLTWPAALRRQSLLHWLVREAGVSPTTGQLRRLVEEIPQLMASRTAGHWPELKLRLYRGVLSVERTAHEAWPPNPMGHWRWAEQGMTGAGWWRFAQTAGVWEVQAVASGGVSSEILAALRPRARQGGERWQAAPGRPARSLKKQFQAAGVPAWMRDAPLLWMGDALVLVPGLGVDARWLAPPGQAQWQVMWRALAPEMHDTSPGQSDNA